MSIPVQLTLAESAQELKKLFSKASVHLRPRIKMLQCVSQGIHANSDLAAKTGAGIGSIIRWKQTYLSGGIGALAGDARGGDFRSNFSAAQKEQLRLRLSDPTNAFTSYGKVREWISTELGVEMSYTAVYAFLRRNFGTKLKVGRKSHVKKDELAAAVFKNAT